jgi:nitrogenase molybdenum-iron protein alpha/beta subunit
MALDGGKFLGAYRASLGIKDAVVLCHVPMGCHWGGGILAGISRQQDINHVCTALHEREIVFGGESSLERSLLNVASLHPGPAIIVVSGDVPSIIGDDCEAVIRSLDLDKKIALINAPGFMGSMRDGYEDALLCLAMFMMEHDTIEKSVNLIGFCRDDFKVDADIREIKRLLSYAGIKVNCIISNCSFEEFRCAPAAELNVVVGQGKLLAEFMKKEFAIPYIEATYPYGLEKSLTFVEKIGAALDLSGIAQNELDLESYKKIYVYLQKLNGMPVSIIGDYHSSPMAQFLEDELGFDVNVHSNFEDSSFEDHVASSNSIMIFGSSFELNIAKVLGIPLVRYVYPVFDRVSFCDAPFAGIRGAQFLTEDIVNAALMFSDDYITRA